jgi:hypothetical protein
VSRPPAVPLYPFLIAVWLVVVQWRQGIGTAGRVLDLLGSSLGALGIAAAGAALAAALARGAGPRGLVALTVVLWGTLFATFTVFVGRSDYPLSSGDSAIAWTALSALIIVAARRTVVPDGVTKALTFGAAFLILFQGIGLAASARTAAAPSFAGSGRSEARPDIYVIVLDKYSASRWLSESYGLDNRPFEDSLRQLGFVIPSRARTNYPHTSLVLATLFDGAPAHETIGDPDARWAQVYQLAEDASTWRLLRERGYRFVFFPTTFHASARNKNADVTMTRPVARPDGGMFHTVRSLGPLDALISLRCGRRGCAREGATQLQTFPYPLESADAILWKFDAAATLPDSAGPVVALLHLLLPHEPYQFDADCRVQEPWWPLSDADTDRDADATIRAAYAAQVQCVNKLVLGVVRSLVSRSTVPPVILIQSDHGHGRMTVDAMSGRTIRLADLSATQLRERLDVFAAYRTPGHEAIWYDSITPVNVMPTLLNALFDAQRPTHPDRVWWVDDFRAPLRVTELSPEQLRLSTDAPPSP